MPSYAIADVTVTDPETYAGYRKLTRERSRPSAGASSCAVARTR